MTPLNAPPNPEGADDPFRFCVYCGVDCYLDPPELRVYADDIEHADDCPAVTGLFPIRQTDLEDGHGNFVGMKCAECGAEMKLGEHFLLQKTGDSDVFVVVCTGCGILIPERVIDGEGEEPIAW